jgi:hypothetical protein
MSQRLAEPVRVRVRMLGGFFGMLDNNVSHIAQTHQNQAGIQVGIEDNADSRSNR